MLSERRLQRINRAVASGRIVPYLAGVTLLITVAAALAVRIFAHGEFTTFGESMWWAAQTVTTVGYGDVVPQTAFSKVVAVAVMLLGIATVSLLTALVTSAVVNYTQSWQAAEDDERTDAHLDALNRIERRLEALERKLG
jgi:voltage-gated potassium channel